jgi:hypothetical protein
MAWKSSCIGPQSLSRDLELEFELEDTRRGFCESGVEGQLSLSISSDVKLPSKEGVAE